MRETIQENANISGWKKKRTKKDSQDSPSFTAADNVQVTSCKRKEESCGAIHELELGLDASARSVEVR